jgi:phosphoserine phosphatase
MNSAAFFRVEGTLTSRPTLATPAWLAANSQALSDRLLRFGSMAVAAPFSLRDSSTAQKLAWSSLRGMSEYRLRILGEEYFEEWLRPKLSRVTKDLISRASDDGDRVILLSDNIDVVMKPLAAHLGIEDLVCNHLEVRNEHATGRLADPAITSHFAGQWARDWAADRDIDLMQSSAYGSSGADSTLLSAIGRPCIVHPDRQLRQIARDLDWPVVSA